MLTNRDSQYQYSTRRPVHRQFIGFSPKTDDYIAAHFIDMSF